MEWKREPFKKGELNNILGKNAYFMHKEHFFMKYVTSIYEKRF